MSIWGIWMNEFEEKFPETGWICPYCMGECEDSETATVDRKDIPSHLVFQHGWDVDGLTWENIYSRLVQIGGV